VEIFTGNIPATFVLQKVSVKKYFVNTVKVGHILYAVITQNKKISVIKISPGGEIGENFHIYVGCHSLQF
jgi:hypothetical protein